MTTERRARNQEVANLMRPGITGSMHRSSEKPAPFLPIPAQNRIKCHRTPNRPGVAKTWTRRKRRNKLECVTRIDLPVGKGRARLSERHAIRLDRSCRRSFFVYWRLDSVVVVVVDSAPLARQSQVSVTINSSGSVAVSASQKGNAAANNVARHGQRKSLRLRWLWPQFNVFDREKEEIGSRMSAPNSVNLFASDRRALSRPCHPSPL